MWEKIINFLAEYDIHTLGEAARNLNWGEVIKTPTFWLIALPLSGWIVWRKQFKILIVIGSFFALSFLFQYSLPPSGQDMGLMPLLKFLGGALVIISINIYFFFLRQD